MDEGHYATLERKRKEKTITIEIMIMLMNDYDKGGEVGKRS